VGVLGCGGVARRNKSEEREIARERIARLVALAEEAVRAGRFDRAHRYAELAWRIKTTYQMRGSAIDGRACRECHHFLAPGSTSRVRFSGGKRSVTCLGCGAVRRTPIARRGVAATALQGDTSRGLT
jgi:ribonuclease P protein subunit RPR2